MDLLLLVAQCNPGDTINLSTMTITSKSFLQGLSRWWHAQSRRKLIERLEGAVELYRKQPAQSPVSTEALITGLTSLILTYNKDTEITERLRHLIELLEMKSYHGVARWGYIETSLSNRKGLRVALPANYISKIIH